MAEGIPSRVCKTYYPDRPASEGGRGSGVGQPSGSATGLARWPAQVNAQAPLQQLVQEAPETSWRMAELEGTLRYLRGAKGLRMPLEFRQCFELEGRTWHDPVVG